MNENHYMGAPCRKGHGGLRYRTNRECVECKRLRKKKERLNSRAPLMSRKDEKEAAKLAIEFAVTPRVTGLKEYHEERRGP